MLTEFGKISSEFEDFYGICLDWPVVEDTMLNPNANVDLLMRKYKERDEHGRLATELARILSTSSTNSSSSH